MVFTGERDGLTVDSLRTSLPRSTISQMVICFSRLYAHFVVVHFMVCATPSSSSFRRYLPADPFQLVTARLS